MTPPGLRVAVIRGGPAREHDVSLASGRAVETALRSVGLDVVAIDVDRTGRWRLPGSAPPGPAGLPGPRDEALTAIAPRHAAGAPGGVDVAFLALHGPWGEDGTVQGLLESLGVPYTGSGVLASALAMDKERTKEVLLHHGLATPPWVGISARQWADDPVAALGRAVRVPAPWVVKPARDGSSFGVTLADDADQLESGLRDALAAPGARVLVEQRIAGTEVTCPVLGNHDAAPRTLPLVEIVPEGRAFFDFAAKYEGASREICPARIADDVAARVRAGALLAHEVLGCDGLSRSDFMVDHGGAVWFLETNTIPGMTPASLCPLSAREAGVSFEALCRTLVDLALARRA